MPRKQRTDDKVWNDIEEIRQGTIFRAKDIENLAVEAMSRHSNGKPIHKYGTGMVVEIVRNLFRYHRLTKTMRQYGKV